MEVIYRKLLPEDKSTYRTIRLECLRQFPEYFGATYEEQILLPQLAFEQYIEERSPYNFIIGAFADNELIGTCGVSKQTRLKTRHIAEIIQMFVNPSFKGKHIGLGLLRAAIEEAFRDPVIEQLILNVVTTNGPAIHVYEQAGFKEYGMLRNNFKSGASYADQRSMVLYRSDYFK